MSSSLLLSNWLTEVAEEKTFSQPVTAFEALMNEEELTPEQIQEYQECDQLCPFNLITAVPGSNPAATSATTCQEEEGSSSREGEVSEYGEEEEEAAVAVTTMPAQSTASRQTSNATNPSEAQPEHRTTAAPPLKQHQSFRVFSTHFLGLQGADASGAASDSLMDDNDESHAGLSPDYRSRKSSNACMFSTGLLGSSSVSHPLNAENLDFVSRKAYYSPRSGVSMSGGSHTALFPHSAYADPSSHIANTSTTSPSLTATSSFQQRSRCWVDLPEETTALFSGETGNNGRVQRTNTSTLVIKLSSERRLSSAPAPEELLLGDAVVVSCVPADVELLSWTSSEEEQEDEDDDVIDVISWLDVVPIDVDAPLETVVVPTTRAAAAISEPGSPATPAAATCVPFSSSSFGGVPEQEFSSTLSFKKASSVYTEGAASSSNSSGF